MTSRFILSLQREVVNRRTPEETLMKSFPAVAIMNRGAPQAKQSPIELHNLGQLTSIGPSIFVVIDEIEELSTTEQSSSAGIGIAPHSNHLRRLSRPLSNEK
ncbi:hypothetical protein FRB91_001639 [Serendipita sp. 411]|nr:hypothetical protein FRC18_003794 [Serendipita sp. 400]KAG8845571.1 hypothetical protein FRB91_001639 [Serendipita sp. 411]